MVTISFPVSVDGETELARMGQGSRMSNWVEGGEKATGWGAQGVFDLL
jgi:hypothetical protein